MRKLHLINWYRKCSNKSIGGLGIRNMQVMNKAFLAKLAWRINNGNSWLILETLVKKYCTGENFLQIEGKPGDSWAWKSILTGKELLKEQVLLQIKEAEVYIKQI